MKGLSGCQSEHGMSLAANQQKMILYYDVTLYNHIPSSYCNVCGINNGNGACMIVLFVIIIIIVLFIFRVVELYRLLSLPNYKNH